MCYEPSCRPATTHHHKNLFFFFFARANTTSWSSLYPSNSPSPYSRTPRHFTNKVFVPVQYCDRGVTAPGLFSWSAAAAHPPGGTGAAHTAPCSEKPHKEPPFCASPIRAKTCCLILFSENLDSDQYYKKKFLLFIEHQTPLKGLLPTNNCYNDLTPAST